MKNVPFLILTVLLTHLSFSQTMTVHKNDQTTTSFQLSQIDSITFTPELNKALQFNGSTDYIRLPSSSSLTSFANEITVEAWVRVAAYGEDGVIISSGYENEYSFAVKPDGKLGVTLKQVNPQPNSEFIGKMVLALNTWYHVAFSYNGSIESILVNGVVDTSFSTSGDVSTAQYEENISIGVYSYDNYTHQNSFLNGILDEVRIWNIGRSASEIQSTMNSELLGTEFGLMGYWKFNGNVLDGSPNGNNGTIFGNPIFVNR